MAISAQIKNINPWHRDLADWLILNANSPGWGRRGAEHFKVTRAWLSTVIHSDAFQDYYLRRRDEVTKPALFTAKEKLTGTLDQAIEHLQDRIEEQGPTMPLGNLLDAIDILGKRTGLSERGSENSPNVVNNILLVDRSTLEESRARMRGKPKEFTDALAIEGSLTAQTEPSS